MDIRKLVTMVEETRREQGRAVLPAARKAAAVAVIRNPYAGRYDEELEDLQEAGAALGDLLVRRAVEALGIDGADIQSYGKAAIVGEAGEREHAAAVLHPRLGRPVRSVVGPAASIMPSTKKIGGPGTVIDCPLHHKNEIWTFSHFDAMEISLADAPRADEILVAVVLSDSGRPLGRMGAGVRVADVMAGGRGGSR